MSKYLKSEVLMDMYPILPFNIGLSIISIYIIFYISFLEFKSMILHREVRSIITRAYYFISKNNEIANYCLTILFIFNLSSIRLIPLYLPCKVHYFSEYSLSFSDE
jgi:hypothetical protein